MLNTYVQRSETVDLEVSFNLCGHDLITTCLSSLRLCSQAGTLVCVYILYFN